MSLEIRHYPDHLPERAYCLVWTRKVDGQEVRFHCSTKEDCERMLPGYQKRAAVADEKGWPDL